jgi:hypothetical protein
VGSRLNQPGSMRRSQHEAGTMAHNLRRNGRALALTWLLVACSGRSVAPGGRDAATGDVSDVPAAASGTGGTERVDTLPGSGGVIGAGDVDGREGSRDLAGEGSWLAVDGAVDGAGAEARLAGAGGATGMGGVTDSGAQGVNDHVECAESDRDRRDRRERNNRGVSRTSIAASPLSSRSARGAFR